MKFLLKKCILIASIIIITGCNNEQRANLKEFFNRNKISSSFDCAQLQNMNSVLEIINEGMFKFSQINLDDYKIKSKYIFVTTTSSQPKTTTCSARVNYKFPFQLENDKGVDLDIIYTINANEVDSDSEVITLNTPEYDILQAYIKRIDDIKAELFSKKLSIPLIKPEKTYQKTIFNDLQEMLKTNEWIEVSTKKSCQYEKNHNENLCSYTFSKNNYLYIVNTKQENECFICSKKPEFVHETRILENP